jgi:sugar fermentation stimulation protein A
LEVGRVVILNGNLVPATFLSRENRFLAKVTIQDKVELTHIPNTGRLREILTEGRMVYLSLADNPKRKTKYTVILAEMDDTLISIDSTVVNTMAHEFLGNKKFHPFSAYSKIRREWKFHSSRFDLLLSKDETVDESKKREIPDLVVEVKGVTLVRNSVALFPDAQTLRGQRHLLELIKLKKLGYRTTVFFVVQRGDAKSFAPNYRRNPSFAEALTEAKMGGVEIHAFTSKVTLKGLKITTEIPVSL